MENIFVEFLPPWIETGIQPAFYDKESGTVLQQVARMYAKVNYLIEMFNKFSKDTTDYVNDFVDDTTETVNDYIAKFVALKDYVDDYFENLDVQEEINNKLDAMEEAGTLQEIITTYIQSNVAWTFDTVADMKLATNLIAGSYAQTLGYYTVGDGGGALYYITDTGTANEKDIVAVDSSLYANIVVTTDLTPEMFGAYGDGTHDDTAIIQYCMNYASTNSLRLLLLHSYLVKPTVDASDNSNRKICLSLVSNLNMEGIDKNAGFIIADENTNSNKYWAFLYSPASDTHNNVTLRNFKIYQNDTNVSSMELNVYNPRYPICLYSEIHNLIIDDILFTHVYGRDIIMINNVLSSSVVINNSTFNFFDITDRVSAYDCSIIFISVHDYECMNNYMTGADYICASGLELHGYNGSAKENRIYGFQNGMHIQPAGTNPANIEVEDNTIKCYDGINIWDNTNALSNYGLDVIRICNNYITIDCDNTSEQYIGGIRTSTSTFTHPIENLLIDGNTIEFVDIDPSIPLSPAYCGAIVFNCKTDMKNIIITNNNIISSVSAGLQVGSTSANATNVYSNIIVANNIFKNTGLVTASNPVYNSVFYCGNGTFKNYKIKDNIIINDISGKGSEYVVTRSGTFDTSEPSFFIDNIIRTVNSGYLAFNDGTSGFIKEDESRIPIKSLDNTVHYIKVANDGTLSTSTTW